MKLSKKYIKKIKKRLIGCMSSIAICLMLIAGSDLAGISTPISNLKNLSKTASNADETKVINNINLEQDSVGTGLASERK